MRIWSGLQDQTEREIAVAYQLIIYMVNTS